MELGFGVRFYWPFFFCLGVGDRGLGEISG